ncbi:Methyltransf-2 domain-containing protein [Mycena chlorophos]|uniref:Methyltransf-2 domain-containing protein n=1 Tax=Mycena chlorophos TaxID=658473 RepID=A0A8H6SL16_MYCCL|nr:Methyltransf-2 domain-containing protein [Mycena chlorophos]
MRLCDEIPDPGLVMADHISALLALIHDAAQTLQRRFEGNVPTLDDTRPHPLDTELWSPEANEAVQVLEGACAQLCATLARPSHTLVNQFFMAALKPGCLRVALEFKIPDILEAEPAGLHVAEIGKRCGGEPTKIARVLRLLAAEHCFREVEHDVFANNRLSVYLLSSNPLRSFGLHTTGPDVTGTAGYLADTLLDERLGGSFEVVHSTWNQVTGHSTNMFEHWEENPELGKGQQFAIGMLGWNTVVQASTMVHVYPWASLPAGSSICDLGGGVGALSLQLARAHPHLKIVLQDVQGRVIEAETVVWPSDCPDALEDGRVQFKAINLLDECQLPVEGCEVYYMKNILHGFTTAQCLALLSRIRKVMKPGSRLLIHEYLLQTPPVRPDLVNEQSTNRSAPAPLLHNYGTGGVLQYYIDIAMLLQLNSADHTLDEYVEWGEQVGLKFLRVWEFGEMGGVEFGLAE